jgi:hypothetical protein
MIKNNRPGAFIRRNTVYSIYKSKFTKQRNRKVLDKKYEYWLLEITKLLLNKRVCLKHNLFYLYLIYNILMLA